MFNDGKARVFLLELYVDAEEAGANEDIPVGQMGEAIYRFRFKIVVMMMEYYYLATEIPRGHVIPPACRFIYQILFTPLQHRSRMTAAAVRKYLAARDNEALEDDLTLDDLEKIGTLLSSEELAIIHDALLKLMIKKMESLKE
ncbi:hypothetical protein KQX54_004660 [Cotesia glomerata]|uniref:Uncharacterized protein n=1 Tax=Cotesia glomerata TaxID=32391 RepID=A0AAV7J440_COTGL|nr:hypothetical protein KQX54_004660 [Cotesia glomerata]